MDICLICQEYPPDTVGGGIGTYTTDIARGLLDAGHRVWVIARAVKGIETTTRENGLQVHRILPAQLPGVGRLDRRRDRKTFADAYLYSLATAAKVRQIMGQHDLDVVQSPEHGAEGFALARDRAPVPHVVRFHSPLFMVNEASGRRLSLGGRVVHALERAAARRAVLNTSASLALARAVSRAFGIPLERVRVVPNSIDHEAFCPAPGIAPHPPTVLYVGKIAPLKGMATLAEAIPQVVRGIPEVRVVLIGSDHVVPGAGSTKEQMLTDLRRAGVADRVSVLAPVERSQLVRLYQEADVCVLPTLWDNFPNTCLEAMACGVPVVASAVGGLPEIIDNGKNGVLVPPGDAAGLADAVVGLLERRERRLEMGRAARNKILEAYTRSRVVAATIAVYNEAIARFRERAMAG